MILFYSKQSGNIVGSIHGRVHDAAHLNMWVGSKEENGRLVIQWHPVRFYDQNGVEVEADHPDAFSADWAPRAPKPELFTHFDQHPNIVHDYKVVFDENGRVIDIVPIAQA